MIYVLDANAVIWYLSGDSLLSDCARRIIDDPGEGNFLAIPTIVLVEAWDRARKERREFVPIIEVIRSIRSMNVLVVDFTLSNIRSLPDLWSDSRDMMILAAALEMRDRYGEATLISSDTNIRCNQSLVPCIW